MEEQMNTRARYDDGERSMRAGVSSDSTDNSGNGGGLAASTVGAVGSMVTNAVDLMVRLPLQATAAGLDWMTSGSQGQDRSSAAGQEASGANSAGFMTTLATRQDLSGPDLKYVVWTVVFNKPGYETILEPMQSELLNYSTDVSSYAALKIAKTLDRGRFGKIDKPSAWVEHGYPAESAAAKQRAESHTETKTGSGSHSSSQSSSRSTESAQSEKGWRIPGEDQKYVQFLYRVEWRLPKQQEERRVETVTIETETRRSM
jgi:hypothetical protein